MHILIGLTQASWLLILFASVFPPSCLLVRAQSAHNACKKTLIRREWRTLTANDKAAWTSAVKCLGTLNHRRLSFDVQGRIVPGAHSLYDDFSYAHNAMSKGAHDNAYFLPWHRWFLYIFDSTLRDGCGYSGPTPYWDWSRDSADLLSSPIFETDPAHGLGHSGDCTSAPSSDCVVQDGAFAPANSHFSLSYPVRHNLRRNLTLITGWFEHEHPANETISLANIRNITERTTGDFFRFQFAMTQMHNHLHNFVGGDLAGTCPKAIPEDKCEEGYTPNEPLFWLHHAQLDRLWSNWQSLHPSNFFAFSGVPLNTHNLTDPRYDLNASITYMMQYDRLSVPVPVSSTFDHSTPPFCYKYEDSL